MNWRWSMFNCSIVFVVWSTIVFVDDCTSDPYSDIGSRNFWFLEMDTDWTKCVHTNWRNRSHATVALSANPYTANGQQPKYQFLSMMALVGWRIVSFFQETLSMSQSQFMLRYNYYIQDNIHARTHAHARTHTDRSSAKNAVRIVWSGALFEFIFSCVYFIIFTVRREKKNIRNKGTLNEREQQRSSNSAHTVNTPIRYSISSCTVWKPEIIVSLPCVDTYGEVKNFHLCDHGLETRRLIHSLSIATNCWFSSSACLFFVCWHTLTPWNSKMSGASLSRTNILFLSVILLLPLLPPLFNLNFAFL